MKNYVSIVFEKKFLFFLHEKTRRAKLGLQVLESGVILVKVEFSKSEIETMQTALNQWGLEAQIGQAVEECAELIVALQKYVNRTPIAGNAEKVLDEIADVEMMLAQIRLALNIDDKTLRKRMKCKFDRLAEYLAKDTV